MTYGWYICNNGLTWKRFDVIDHIGPLITFRLYDDPEGTRPHTAKARRLSDCWLVDAL